MALLRERPDVQLSVNTTHSQKRLLERRADRGDASVSASVGGSSPKRSSASTSSGAPLAGRKPGLSDGREVEVVVTHP